MNEIEIIEQEVPIQQSDLVEKCGNCQSQKFTIEENGPHASQKCDECGAHLDFVKQKNNSKKVERNYTVQDVVKHKNYEQEFCFNCYRTREQLGYKETLEVDHIKELDDGGKDRPKNLRVLCTKCHKQRNHDKLYINEHLQKHYRKGEEK